MHVHMSVDIEAPPEKVWPYLVEPDKTMQWYSVLKKFHYTSEKAGPDSTFYWEQEVRGKTYATHFKTTEWVENRIFAYEQTSGNFHNSDVERWEIEETPTGSRFSWEHHAYRWTAPDGPFRKIVDWLGERLAKRSSQEVLRKLKRLAEA